MTKKTNKDSGSGFRHFLLVGCLVPFVSVALIVGIMIMWRSCNNESKPPAYIVSAEKQVKQQQAKLQKRRTTLPDKSETVYDPDQTAMALFSIEKALAEAGNFEELTALVLQKDSDLVAPEVAELKYRFFNIYKDLLRAQDDFNAQKSLYNIAAGALLDVFSAVKIDFSTSPAIDHEQAKAIWLQRLKKTELRDQMSERLRKQEDRLLDFYFDYMKISSKYLKQWNTLCSYRDRAYIAIFEGDLESAIKNAGTAVKLAPYEKEAHLLLARCLLERGAEVDNESAKILIDEFIKKHQGQEAPAYLLRGVLKMKDKQYDAAIIDFDQAATYYPKQQEVLLDRLNLYNKRNFLNKSKEGRTIVNMYRGMMTGSGFFSPDFQLARVYKNSGMEDKSKKKIFDHFFRRRLQGQWDRVLTDFRYCNKYLDTDPMKIEGQNIGLEISPAFFFNSVIVKVRNDSKKDIHNVTVLLCVRFTDMFKGDYISFPVGATAACVPAGQSLTVGRQDITEVSEAKIGTKKQFKDIIDYAAVLISDEIITWVEPRPAQIKEDQVSSVEKVKVATDIAKTLVDLVKTGNNTAAKEKSKALAEKIIKDATRLLSAKDKNTDEYKARRNKLINDLLDAAVEMMPQSKVVEKDGKQEQVEPETSQYMRLLRDMVKVALDPAPEKEEQPDAKKQ